MQRTEMCIRFLIHQLLHPFPFVVLFFLYVFCLLLATYTSKEVYDGFKAELNAYREEASSSREIQKTLDVVGPINVDVG